MGFFCLFVFLFVFLTTENPVLKDRKDEELEHHIHFFLFVFTASIMGMYNVTDFIHFLYPILPTQQPQ